MTHPIFVEVGALASDSYWRSLRYFSIYRLAIATLFLLAILSFGDALNLGAQNFVLFRSTAWAYVLVAAGFLILLLRRPRSFNLQLSGQVVVDVLALTMMMFASGGQKSGIAVLLLVVVTGAGLVGQGRLTLFYASIASLAMLLEESWRALTMAADPVDFVRTGLICIAFFGTASVARLLAKRVIANETLAIERGRQLNDQLRISERIIRDMEAGVLVVDGESRVSLLNQRARMLLAVAAPENSQLSVMSRELAKRLAELKGGQVEVVDVLRQPGGRMLRVRYLPAAEAGGNTLIYLEDMARVQSQAQQLKLAALGRLTANMAHEIRNPLASISHAAELLAEEDGDPVKQRLARIIHDNTQRLNRLVTEVLELGRRDRASAESIGWQSFIGGFMEELALRDTTSARRVFVGGDDFVLKFDRGHLYRVLWNLIGNALRHASDADGAVRVMARQGEVEGRVEICISDDGPGVEEGLRGQVFEPFFTTHGAGTGLGLYIARELCEASGAMLDLTDEGPGAHFIITVEGQACR